MDDGSCIVCFGEEGAPDVYFDPCSHKACRSCVTKLRIAIVYKADKGVRCPVCRAVIHAYRDTPLKAQTPTPTTDSAWVETPFFQETEQILYNRKGITSIGHKNDYVPPKVITGGVKLNSKADELYPGYVVPPLKQDSDLLAMALDKTGARHLDHMLRPGYAKRHKVAKLAREMLTPFVAKLSMNGSANYVLQRMMDYAAENRRETGNGNVECFFTSIVRSLCRDNGLVLAAQDVRGTYSAQKILSLMEGPEELRLVLKGITGSVVLLSLHQTGVYVMQRLAEALVTSLNGFCKRPRVPPNEAVRALAWLATELAGGEQIVDVGSHNICGLMFVETIRWSLPETQSFQAAMTMISHSKTLSKSRYGRRTLQGLLSLEVKEMAEAIIYALTGEYLGLGLDTKHGGIILVSSCLATRCVSEESRLLIVDELLSSCDHAPSQATLLEQLYGCDVLIFGLAILSRRSLDRRYDMIHQHVAYQRFQTLKNLVETKRATLEVDSASGVNAETRMAVASQAARTADVLSRPTTASTAPMMDPWDDEPTVLVRNTLTGARSEGSLSEISAEAADWEQLAGDDTDVRSRSYSPPTTAPNPEVTWHSFMNSGQAVSTASEAPQPTFYPQNNELVPGANVGVIGGQRSGTPVQRPSCVVCNFEEANVVLLDCSHMCSCLGCSARLRFCPVCHHSIRAVLEVKSFSRPSPSHVNSALELPSDLLPTDLFQTLSVCSDLHPLPGVNPYSVESHHLRDDLEMYRSSISQANNRTITAPRRPYRPPDVFRL